MLWPQRKYASRRLLKRLSVRKIKKWLSIGIVIFNMNIAHQCIFADEKQQSNIEFQTRFFDFGMISKNQKVGYIFEFKNVSNKSINITKVRTSCGCVTASVPNPSVPLGETGKINVIFNSYGLRTGEHEKKIYVHSDDSNEPIIILKVKATVEDIDIKEDGELSKASKRIAFLRLFCPGDDENLKEVTEENCQILMDFFSVCNSYEIELETENLFLRVQKFLSGKESTLEKILEWGKTENVDLIIFGVLKHSGNEIGGFIRMLDVYRKKELILTVSFQASDQKLSSDIAIQIIKHIDYLSIFSNGKNSEEEKSYPVKMKSFSVKDIRGNQISQKDLLGKVTLLNFFSTKCPHCNQELPMLISLAEEYKNYDFGIIGINMNIISAEELSSWAKEKGIYYPLVINKYLAWLFDVHRFPCTIIVDQKGTVCLRLEGYSDRVENSILQKISSISKSSK